MFKKKLKRVVLIIVLLLLLLVMLIPLWWALALAFDRKALLAIPSPPRLWPQEFSLFNFEYVNQVIPVLRYFVNTLYVVFLNTVIAVFFAMTTGYAFAKGRFRFKKALFLMLIATMMIPFEARVIPLYLQFHKIHLIGTYWPLILGSFAYCFGTFMCMNHIAALPDCLRESAYLDGAGEWRILLQIIMPNCKPVISSLVILRAVEQWNSYLWPLIVISKREDQLVSVGLSLFASSAEGSRYIGPMMASAMLAILPIVVIYLIMQKQIVAGVVHSGVKG